MAVIPVHPGEILREVYLVEFGLTQVELARRLGLSPGYVGDVVHERRGVTPRLAVGLARVLGTSAQMWLNAQNSWDLSRLSGMTVLGDQREQVVANPRRRA